MITAAAALAVLIVCAIAVTILAIVLEDPGAPQWGDPDTSQPVQRDAGTVPFSGGRRTLPAGWLPATLPAYPPPCPPWRPRVSAGRVALTERIRAAYEVADRPVSDYLASHGWPAQEVTAWA